MNRIQNSILSFFGILICTLLLVIPAATGTTGSAGCYGTYSPDQSSCIPSLSGTVYASVPEPGPVSGTYVPPPGVMPVIILNGTPYEMGYQYGLEAPEYIALVRDAAWAGALSKKSYTEIMESTRQSRQYITKELSGFDFDAFFLGMSDAMNAQGYAFTPDDAVVMLYFGGTQGPVPEEHCTAFAAFGNMTGGAMIVGENFDYYPVPSNSYAVLLALYPENGHAAIIPSGAGRTGSNMAINDKGLVYIITSGPSKGPGDTGPGITGFLELPYVAMTAGTVDDAQTFLLNSTRAFALNHMLADASGNAEVIEATRVRYAIRLPADTGNSGDIIATNHYMNTTMKPSQPTWDSREYYPSSYYRYITAEKILGENAGMVNYTTSLTILSETDWWDGTIWHRNDPYSSNTINRFRPDVATLYSVIAVPGENAVSVCTGNPGMAFWGTRAAGQTGTYVNYTVGKSPEILVYQLRLEANSQMWTSMQLMGDRPDREVNDLYESAENTYWEAVWWEDHGLLDTDRTARAVALGRAATGYSSVIAESGKIQSLCSKGKCS